jgi:hypothetical protein
MVELVFWNNSSKKINSFLEICEQKKGLGFLKKDVTISYLVIYFSDLKKHWLWIHNKLLWCL